VRAIAELSHGFPARFIGRSASFDEQLRTHVDVRLRLGPELVLDATATKDGNDPVEQRHESHSE
jgi:hypothetical protein